MLPRIFALLALFGIAATMSADPPAAAKSPRAALQAFGDLIGAWNGTVTPAGPREEAAKNFWTEKMTWEWQFKDKDAWLKVDFQKSKYFTGGEMRYVPDKDNFTLALTDLKNQKITFVGNVETRDTTKILTLVHDGDKESQRLVFTFLHDNYIRYRYEVKPDGKQLFSKKWDSGARKEGVAFAAGDGKPECVVSGGAGTIAVSYMGKTYYVCCSGCRTEFNESPAKYVQEYEAKKAKKK
jgi:YHS domain-containing protein